MPITFATAAFPAESAPGSAEPGDFPNGLPNGLESLVGGNRVRLLDAGHRADVLEAIARARSHVNIEAGFDGPDSHALLHRLTERSRAGTRINLIADGMTPLPAEALLEAGVRVCASEPAGWRRLLRPGAARRRLVVVDGSTCYVGADGALPLVVDGPVVQRLQRVFVARWQCHATVPMKESRYFPPLPVVGTQLVGVAAGDPLAGAEACHDALLGAIDAARNAVLLSAPGRLPPTPVVRALAGAVGRGVDVALLLPAATDDGAAARVDPRVPVWRAPPGRPPAEACVVDGAWCGLGPVAGRSGDVYLVVVDAGFADRLQTLLLAGARAEPGAGRRRSMWARCRDSIARHLHG